MVSHMRSSGCICDNFLWRTEQVKIPRRRQLLPDGVRFCPITATSASARLFDGGIKYQWQTLYKFCRIHIREQMK